MPHPNRPRPSQLHHHQTHGAEPDAQSARQGLLTTQAKGRRMGRGLPRQPHRSVICSPDCPDLPPHSPDFNPIENAFAKLKALLRKAAERTVEGLWTAIGRLIEVFTPTECANYFAAAGYDAT